MYTSTPEKKEETPESFQNESGWTVGYYRDVSGSRSKIIN